MNINLQSIRQTCKTRLPDVVLFAIFVIFLLTLPLYMRIDITSIFTKILIFGIFALSLDLIFGYAGLVSLGHAAFFGAGGYAVGLLILKGGIESFWLATPAAILIVGLIAAVFGAFALRLKGVYFILITFTLAQLVYSVVFRWNDFTGGKDGLSRIPPPDFGFPFSPTIVNSYYFVLVIFGICYLLLYLIIKSPFGHTLKGIGENELRMQALGYNTWVYKYMAYIIAGMFAGVAGTSFAYVNWFMSPISVDVVTSATVMIMVIIGGSKTFFGPLLGAAVIILLQYIISLYIPERWPLIIGAAFVAAVMYARGGIMIHLNRIWANVRRKYGSSQG